MTEKKGVQKKNKKKYTRPPLKDPPPLFFWLKKKSQGGVFYAVNWGILWLYNMKLDTKHKKKIEKKIEKINFFSKKNFKKLKNLFFGKMKKSGENNAGKCTILYQKNSKLQKPKNRKKSIFLCLLCARSKFFMRQLYDIMLFSTFIRLFSHISNNVEQTPRNMIYNIIGNWESLFSSEPRKDSMTCKYNIWSGKIGYNQILC